MFLRMGDYCQSRNELLTLWSQASTSLSVAGLDRSALPGIEMARRETQKAQEAFDAPNYARFYQGKSGVACCAT